MSESDPRLAGAPPSARMIIFRLLLSVVAFAAAGVFFYRIPSGPAPEGSGSAAVEIRTVPAGALVFVDGRLAEHTPCTIELKKGESRAVTLRHDGYREVNHLLTAGDSPVVELTLAPIPIGGLKISSLPSGAAVFLEDTFLGKTPLESERIPSGRYLLRLTRANYNPRTEAVEIGPDKVAEVHAVLESKVESFYKTAIAGEPGNIPFRTELAHYYLITDRKDDSIAEYTRAFETAGDLAIADHKALADVGRLINEIKKIKHEHADIIKALMPSIESMVDKMASADIPHHSLQEVAKRLKMIGRNDLAMRLGGSGREARLGFMQLQELQKKALAAQKAGDKGAAYKLHLQLAGYYAKFDGKIIKGRVIEHLRKAANLNDDPSIRVDLGLRIAGLYRETGQAIREREVLEKVMALMPAAQAGNERFWKAAAQLSRSYQKADQTGSARKVYEDIIQKYPQPEIRSRAEKELKKLK